MGLSKNIATTWKAIRNKSPQTVRNIEHAVNLYFFHIVLRIPRKKANELRPTRNIAIGVIRGSVLSATS